MEKVEKGSCMISMHSPHFPEGKINFTVENGYVSGKQLLTALGLKARVLLPKIQDAPQITLKSTSKPDSLGFLPESLVLVMKSVRLASVKNPLAITFVIDTLSDVVNSRGSIYEQMEDAKIAVPEPKIVIDLDRKPLTPSDVFRRDASFTSLQGDDINALVTNGVIPMYDQNGNLKMNIVGLDSYSGRLRALEKGGLLNVRDAMKKFPEKLVFDTQTNYSVIDRDATTKSGKIVRTQVRGFLNPQPWVTRDLLIEAENKRSQIARDEYEAKKKAMLEAEFREMKAEEVNGKTKRSA